jgi:hypothetical protein
MQDELDPQLLRSFAENQRPLADAQFVARVSAQLHAGASLRSLGAGLRAAVRATFSGLLIGLVAPLRLKYAGLVALAGAAVTVWTLLQGA